MVILINYRDINNCGNEEVDNWVSWCNGLDVNDIVSWIDINYNLNIKDIYNIHFITEKQVLNMVFCIQNQNSGIRTYTGTEGELLTMFSIVINNDNLENLKRVSNIVDKKYIIRDIILNNLI